jgi:hypothetical protein
MNRGWVAAALAAVALLGATGLTPAAGAADGFDHLRPGAQAKLTEKVPVQYVFVGIEKDELPPTAFVGELPRSYEPIERVPSFYGNKRPLGITYSFDHRLVFADRKYEDRAFKALADMAEPAPVTTMQTRYNAQPGVLDIDENHVISAPKTELWLAKNPPSGVDTTRNTIFFIDWYGREDFRFHVYEKVGEAKPDTGYDYGPSGNNKMTAWGGTAADDPEDGHGLERRVWFYDLSAGPEYWTGNWNVTTDFDPTDGNVSSDARVPPSWEYGEDAFRSPKLLPGDLGKMARYVGIDLLFTPSPLYPVAIDGPTLPRTVELDMNFYDLPNAAISTMVKRGAIVRSLEGLAPWLSLSATADPADMADPEHANCYAQWAYLPAAAPSCYPGEAYGADASLYLYHSKNSDLFFDGSSDHEAGSFNYQTVGGTSDCFAFADDDHSTGAQGFVYSFIGPACQDTIGFTDLLAHEYGHHLGMSHPHDGYDSEEDRHFAAQQGAFNFAWAGTEVNSVMSYTNTNNEFSQFDQDNMARWATAAYLTETNAIARAILGAGASTGQLEMVDRLAGSAKRLFAQHEYRDAVSTALDAYDAVVRLARQHRVQLKPAKAAELEGKQAMPLARRILLDPISPSGGFER